MSEDPKKKRGLLAIAGGGVLAIGTALASGFFSSVGEKAGQMYLHEENATQSTSAPAVVTGSAGPVAASSERQISTPAGGPPEETAMPIVIDTVDLVFGGEASASTRSAACSEAIRNATQRAEYQCESIARQQNASSFELGEFEKSCTQCGELSSNWRCVTRVRPVCKIIE